MTLLVLYLALALVVSFCCSLLEATILSATPAHIELLAQAGRRSGRLLRRLKGRIDRPIIAILTLNTVAHTVGAAGVGAQVQVLYGNQWVALGSALLTLAILVFTEVIPKTLGATYWKALAPSSAHLTASMIVVLWPLVWLLERISRLLSKGGHLKTVTREEMIVHAEMGKDAGVLRRGESRVIKNLMRLRDIQVHDIMTPRKVVQAYPCDMTVGEVMKQASPLPFSRIPVYGRDVDDVVGIVFRHRVLEASARGRTDLRLDELKVPIRAIPETASVASALDEFIRRQQHLMLVVDEYGGTEGIVTLEDAIETLLGVEIVDELDSVEDMRKLALDLWERRKARYAGLSAPAPPSPSDGSAGSAPGDP
ncbi:MAG: HlyC/CorC family transporter [Planctomycetes bacterium]|nr:HlyC/CorC family transporter [Planctomycetota bacterium]